MALERKMASPSVSLDRQIGDAERRLARRRHSSSMHAAALAQRLRDAVSSPIALLLAAGVGFAASQLSLLRKTEPPERVDAGGAGGHSLLATIMEGLGLAGTLMAMLPKGDAADAAERGGRSVL